MTRSTFVLMALSVAACGGLSTPVPTTTPTAVPTATCAAAFSEAALVKLHTIYDLDQAVRVCTLAEWRTQFEAHADRLDARFSGTADSVLTNLCLLDENADTALCQEVAQQ